MSDNAWYVLATGRDIPSHLHACRLLNIAVQIQNDGTTDAVLLAHSSGIQLINRVRMASTKGWISGAPIVDLARAYKADPEMFSKILDCIHVVLALGEGEIGDIVKDLLKLGEGAADG